MNATETNVGRKMVKVFCGLLAFGLAVSLPFSGVFSVSSLVVLGLAAAAKGL